MQKPINIDHNKYVDILTEVYLHTYCSSKGILLENLSEGFIEKLKNKIKKLNLPPMGGLLASLLSKVKSLLGPKNYELFLSTIEAYDGPKDLKSITDYINSKFNDESVNEGILNIFRSKKTGDPNALSKSITTILLAAKLAMLINSASPGAFNQVKQAVNDDNIPKIEKVNDVPSALDDLGGSEKNIKLTNDLLKNTTSSTKTSPGENEKSTLSTNTISIEDSGKTIKVGFDTGEFKISNEDETAKKIADDIIKQANGKDIKSLKLGIKGLISNTPGVGDDDPNGPGKKGLGDNRLEAGKDLAKKVSDILKKQFPKAQIDIEDDGTNVNNPGDEVGLNSDAAKKNQAVDFTIKDLKTDDGKKAPTKTISSPDDAGYLRNPRVVQSDANKLYTILGHILPLIINDDIYNAFFSEITTALNTDAKNADKNTFITRNYLEKKIKESTKENSNFTKILKWAVAVDRDSKSIGAFINSLDPKIPKLGKPGGGFLPGKAGKAANKTGSAPTSLNYPGPQSPEETNKLGETYLTNIYHSLLTEASVSDFTSLPGYNEAKAKTNIGILVPIYCYTWDVSDNGAIDYVATNEQYKEGFNKFSNKYPVIASKIGKRVPNEKSKDKTSTTDKKDKSNTSFTKQPGDKYLTSPFDKELDGKKPLSPDITNIIKATNRDNSYKQYLNRINTQDELANFILALFLYRDKQGGKLFNTDKAFTTNAQKAKSALFATANRLKLEEEDNLDPKTQAILDKYKDVKSAYIRIGQSATLRNVLSKINNSKEFAEFILDAVFPYVNMDLRSDKTKLRQAITKAANAVKEYDDIMKKNELSNVKKSDINISEQFLHMQRLAGVITEAQYKQKLNK